MSINYNQLTPACYAIANANDVDLGVGDSMLQNNIRLGRDEHKGAMVLPRAFRPDWAALLFSLFRKKYPGVCSGHFCYMDAVWI